MLLRQFGLELGQFGFARAQGPVMVFVLFAVYGLFHALTEGPEKAFVADLTPAAARGRSFGLYHAVTGAMVLPGNLLTGLLWQHLGGPWALTTGAGLAALSSFLLLVVGHEPRVDRVRAGV